MNAQVSKLIALSPKDLVISPSVSVLAQLNSLADNHMRVGPIPSALLCSKILASNKSPGALVLHPVLQKTINALSYNLTHTVPQFSTSLAIKTFNSFALAGHPLARRFLGSIQDKWFENWNPASVAKGSRRPKLKQAMVGIYDDDSNMKVKIKFTGDLRAISSEDIAECVNAIEFLRTRGVNFEDLSLITGEIKKEFSRRSSAPGIDNTNSAQRSVRTGSWLPYVPRLGVSTGCRTGTRNETETYNILHLSRRFEQPTDTDHTSETPAAAKSSFSGSSTIPDDVSSNTRPSRVSNARSNECSLGHGAIPQSASKLDARVRLHSGKISEQTLTLGEHGPVVESKFSRRRNRETLVPPDNLSLGLRPIDEFSIDVKKPVRRGDNTNMLSSLGPGLVPLPRDFETFDEHVEDPKEVTQTSFKRVYGINAYAMHD